MTGEWHAAADPGTLKGVLGTSFGRVWMWRVALGAVAVAMSILPYAAPFSCVPAFCLQALRRRAMPPCKPE
jgi:putative copper export protein